MSKTTIAKKSQTEIDLFNKFVDDMRRDYYSAPQSKQSSHWIENYNIYNMLRDMFPVKATSEVKIWELFYTFLAPILLKNEDVHILHWKLKHECEHKQFMLVFAHLDPHTDKSLMKEKIINPIVYFVRCHSTENIKIGKTNFSPFKRMAQFGCGSSESYELLGIIHGDKESEYHKKFKEYRIKGEWFEPHTDLLDFIRNNAVQYNDNKIS